MTLFSLCQQEPLELVDLNVVKERFTTCEVGNLSCNGGGENSAPIYYRGQIIGYYFANNGTCGYEAGEIGCYLMYKNVSEVPGNEYVCCSFCGDGLVEVDERYCAENPNASLGYYNRVQNEHEDSCIENPDVRREIMGEIMEYLSPMFGGRATIKISNLRTAAIILYSKQSFCWSVFSNKQAAKLMRHV